METFTENSTLYDKSIRCRRDYCLQQSLKLKLLRGPNEDLQSNPRAAFWRWRNNVGAWTLLETAFTSYVLRKVSWVIGKSSLAVSTFV